MQISHKSNRLHYRVATKIGCILFQLLTRGLSEYTFQVRFSDRIVVENGQLFENVQFNHQNGGVDRMPSIEKERLSREKYIKTSLGSFQKTKWMQSIGSVFADRNGQVKKTKLELELIKTVDFFLDDHSV